MSKISLDCAVVQEWIDKIQYKKKWKKEIQRKVEKNLPKKPYCIHIER